MSAAQFVVLLVKAAADIGPAVFAAIKAGDRRKAIRLAQEKAIRVIDRALAKRLMDERNKGKKGS